VKKVDVSSFEDVENFFNWFHETIGEVSILVNNAGVRRDSIIAMMAKEDWQRVIDVNLNSIYNMSKFAIQSMMRERFGRIINITSPSGKFGFKGQANYAATKAGMVAVTKSVSKEVASRGITVNCVSPGFIDTGFIADLSDDQKKAYKKDIPMKRFGKPEEVANGVIFLSSPMANYINGTTLEITGGL
jgi:3-oxoacyl-[acyl-carrier protein] reductase